MADPKDKTSADTPAKPAGKSSAVKPPVLEGTARPVAAEAPKPLSDSKPKPESLKPDAAKAEAPKPDTAKPAEMPPRAPGTSAPLMQPSEQTGAGAAWLAGLVGGLVGLGAAYGLALLGYWPVPAAAPQEQDPRVAQVAGAVPELQTVTATLQDELARLSARVGGLESNEPVAAAAPVENDQLAGDLAALSARLDELAAAPAEAREASASQAEAIAALEADIAALRDSSAQGEAQLNQVSSQVAALEADVSAGTAAEVGQARLPLIVSGFETALATGAAYDAEVAALRQALPEFAIPDLVLAKAMTGVKRPDLIARDFNAALPDILAGRPVDAEAGWQEATSDWFRGIIALRPTEAVEGDGPEAVVARLEGAIARGDFVAAKTELDLLPPAMRSAAGAVAADIEGQAAAQAFLIELRQSALTGGNGV